MFCWQSLSHYLTRELIYLDLEHNILNPNLKGYLAPYTIKNGATKHNIPKIAINNRFFGIY